MRKPEDAEWNGLFNRVKEFKKDSQARMWSGRVQFTDSVSRELEARCLTLCSDLDRFSNSHNKEMSVRTEAVRVWRELYDMHGLGKAPYGG